MDSVEAQTLIRLGQPRFRSFSDAVEPVLSAIAEAIPGVIALGRLEPYEQGCRVIEVRGAGVDGLGKGSVLPLKARANGDGQRSSEIDDRAPTVELDPEHLKSLGALACLGMPLELSDGRIVGILAALDSRAGAHDSANVALLAIAARLLSHEWESVEQRAELRRLRRSTSAEAKVDTETGLPNRDSFLSLLDHEWALTNRGTVESVLIAFRIGSDPDRAPSRDPRSGLAMKIVAEVLEANARATDRLGRIGEATVAAILVGCRVDDAADFVERVQAALGRVTEGHEQRIELSGGVQALAETPSPEEAFMRAEAAARASLRTNQAEAHAEVNR
ncbi:MAG TPA: GGDEF domain-containing protein [Solirubrobacterales bacterium]|nr:GGDEF domain-containing protein [Solirubrobacterales bacterium]